MNILPYRINIVETDVREKDEQFAQIQELIKKKQHMLLDKRKQLNHIMTQNQFLHVVKNDYDKYYGYIEKQKRDQIKALELLDEYIKELTTTGKLTTHNIEDAREEQRKIIKEIKSIKTGLDTIVNNIE
jgi:hypothetical protein